jgi:fumarylpyruvate hydrolase
MRQSVARGAQLMAYVFDPPAQRSLAIIGSDQRFPINRIFCVGRNYAAHAREMGGDPDREPPFFFMKPPQALVAVDGAAPATIPYPPATSSFHHEIELVVAIHRGGHAIDAARVLDHVYGYAVGLDMTRRDLQAAAKKAGRPWELGKSFAHSAPIGPVSRARDVGHPASGAIELTVNGQAKQRSNLDQLIWSVAECLAQLSVYEPLEPGDLLMTGTPEGVGAVERGDVMRGAIAGLGDLTVHVAR